MISCPLCSKDFVDMNAMRRHLFSSRHRNGQDLIDKIDWLMVNLAEAERAIQIYRALAREQAA